ncbi:hypothetical protein N5D48_24815 [Pseudomonas sp. GD03858]|uniref:hypothetical protein n=1 Tax=unclassified Pseudomonas TaxID=196821 RepID=UPI00244BD1D8|nr:MULTISPECIES: hypothetical protein [unclassified Pseudomonas]MDH0648573.1 hypothetical protein [Pseudomonas sp. GD03867]MDH0665630.1 hypothetical protein [Pseudomonas sp. GD03858]
MPSTIPYDPALALGNLVSLERLDVLEQIAAAQAPADAAEDTLNSLIAAKRSLDMTSQELAGMGIDTSEVDSESTAVGKDVATAAEAFAKAKVASIKAAQPLKAKIAGISDSVESPVDYNRTQIKQMPLSADGLRMNVQYFSLDQNSQQSGTHASKIASFISGQVGIFGDEFASQAAGSSASQVNSQVQNHSISGTLVISVTCTHKDAVLLAPFILDVDKGIRAFNAYFPDSMIKTDSIASMQKVAQQANTKDEMALTLLSGATMGSCFIGMVHILNTTDTRSSETMESVASSLQTQFKVAGWFESVSGGFGVNSSFSNDAKALLSSQNVTSHCTLTTVGSIPSIKSNQVKMGVKQFTDFDGASSMTALLKLQGVTQTDQESVSSAADRARTGQEFMAMKSNQMESALSALSDIDDGANKIIDTNSMMDALDDYIQKCLAGNIGAPITYYLKRITASQLAQAWMAKYYPNKYISISADDSGSGGSGGASGGTGTASGNSDSGGDGSGN